MGYVCRTVTVYPKLGKQWSSSGTVITEAFDIQIKKGLGKIRDTFSFKIPRAREYFQSASNPLVEENLVTIYLWRDSTSSVAGDLQIEGVIRSLNQTIDDTGDIVQVEGDNFTETFFDVQIPLNLKEKTWVEMIQEILNLLARFTNKQVFWDASNPLVKSDGTQFPKKTLILNYTRISEMIEKLTSDDFTEDGQYLYWLEINSAGQYVLKTAFKSSTISGTITQGELDSNIKISKKKDDVVNFVIYNVGTDLYGNAIEDVWYDTESIGKFGYKTYYMTEETQDIHTNLWNNERFINLSDFDSDADNIADLDFPSAYPYTFYNGGTSVADDNSFVEELRRLSKIQGVAFAIQKVTLESKPKYELERQELFTNAYGLGDKYKCNYPHRNINRPIRIQEMDIKITGTKLTLYEDERDATL